MTDDEQDLLAGYRALHDFLSERIEGHGFTLSDFERMATMLADLVVLDQKVRDFDEQDQCS